MGGVGTGGRPGAFVPSVPSFFSKNLKVVVVVSNPNTELGVKTLSQIVGPAGGIRLLERNFGTNGTKQFPLTNQQLTALTFPRKPQKMSEKPKHDFIYFTHAFNPNTASPAFMLFLSSPPSRSITVRRPPPATNPPNVPQTAPRRPQP